MPRDTHHSHAPCLPRGPNAEKIIQSYYGAPDRGVTGPPLGENVGEHGWPPRHPKTRQTAKHAKPPTCGHDRRYIGSTTVVCRGPLASIHARASRRKPRKTKPSKQGHIRPAPNLCTTDTTNHGKVRSRSRKTQIKHRTHATRVPRVTTHKGVGQTRQLKRIFDNLARGA